MPRPAKPKESARALGDRTLVLDNGAFNIKAGFVSSDEETDCTIIPNCIARGKDGRVYIADQLESCKYFGDMAFRRPVEKGYLVNWDGELDIWKQALFEKGARAYHKCDPHETNLVLTEAPNCPQALQTNTDQMIFEEFEFASAYRCVGVSLNAYNDIPEIMGSRSSFSVADVAECVLVVDSGYSFTTVTPILQGRPIQAAIRRIDIGGRFLTNALKDAISLRHVSLMDDSYLVSQMKEDACFVSLDFAGDMERSQESQNRHPRKTRKLDTATDTSLTVDYVLPDYVTTQRGYIRPRHSDSNSESASPTTQSNVYTAAIVASQAKQPLKASDVSIPLSNLRFTIPELIFSPPDIHMPQAGLAEVVVQSLSALPPGLWPAMLANILLVGGTTRLPCFAERLQSGVRALAPAELNVRVRRAPDPVTSTWQGGTRFARDRARLSDAVVTRAEYAEHGASWTARKFAAARALS